ncbi:unnamed protein product [Rotaria sp. Silwood1]|nr:unnamed protein product [Rotaria sp. Silwood1]CAF1583502.1 unnamed protein product [Rotaria sp. Silwood1]CAF1583622.1 unnamed protein product [Rotaria sp. Silwood1]CAF3739048.1 unnamed protein product [Rotaria sp. Silwood1]CAF3753790.1 unnamed protein product [Rotaria sp. Silwood1]
MQSNELPKPLPTTYPTIQGDPATRRFAIFFFCTLAIITIGVMIGIGVGNISHYEYFDSSNISNGSYSILTK